MVFHTESYGRLPNARVSAAWISCFSDRFQISRFPFIILCSNAKQSVTRNPTVVLSCTILHQEVAYSSQQKARLDHLLVLTTTPDKKTVDSVSERTTLPWSYVMCTENAHVGLCYGSRRGMPITRIRNYNLLFCRAAWSTSAVFSELSLYFTLEHNFYSRTRGLHVNNSGANTKRFRRIKFLK